MDAGAAAPSLEAGSIIGDRYRLTRALGEGAMGWVWEGSHVHTGKTYALKFLKGGKDEDRKRFQREVRAAAAVKHPNVVGMHDFVELKNGVLVMVMDMLEGETLGSVLKRENQIALPNLAAMTLPVIAALEAAHAVGVIHRDLKPENVFLAKGEDGSITPKVLDFGVAKLTAVEGLAARTQALTGTGSMVGTPYYMSPEQVVSEKDLDARADVWSLGVVLYECLAGVRPTEADNVGRVLKRILMADFTPLAELRPDLPEEVTALVMKMLDGDREQRTRALADVRGVLAKHAGAQIEEIPGAPAKDAIVIVDRPSPTSFSRADTHRAVSVHAEKSPRSPLRFVAMGGAALAAGVAIFAWRASTAPAGTTTLPPVAPVSVAASAPATAVVPSAEPAAPLASAPPSASSVAVAVAKPSPAIKPVPVKSAPATRASSVASAAPPAPAGTPSAAPAVSAPPPKPASTLASSPKD